MSARPWTTASSSVAARRGRRGFTLLEVMAALSIFLVGITSVLALLSTGTRLHQESLGTALATDAAGEALLLAERELADNDQPPRAAPSAIPLIERPAAEFESIGRPLPGREGVRWYWWIEGGGGALPLRLRVDVIWLQGGKIRLESLERIVPRARSARAEAQRLLRER